MSAETRFARRDTPSAVSTHVSASQGDAPAAPPAQSGSYELQPLPDKSNSPPVRPSPHDDPDDLHASDAPELFAPSPDNRRRMSRTPLLVRSSPAQGTGSYGGLPVLSVSSSPDSDDHVTGFRPSKRKKGKSKLRHSDSPNRRSFVESSLDGSVRSEPPLRGSSSTRRRTVREATSSTPLVGASSEDLSLEARFNTGAVAASGMAVPGDLDSLKTSSSASPKEGSEDESESSDDDLHDTKANGHAQDNSPYAQVRAAVGATDDHTLSINTPRMWALSILFAILGSSTNLFFSLRYPSVSITPIIALLLVHPLGLLWDQFLKRPYDPEEHFENGVLQSRIYSRPGSSAGNRPLRPTPPLKTRCRLWLAQGRWNLKEHCCVYISSNVSFGFAFATDVSTSR